MPLESAVNVERAVSTERALKGERAEVSDSNEYLERAGTEEGAGKAERAVSPESTGAIERTPPPAIIVLEEPPALPWTTAPTYRVAGASDSRGRWALWGIWGHFWCLVGYAARDEDSTRLIHGGLR